MEKKADFKTMSKSERVGFIWDYYKWWIIGAIILIAVAVNLIQHFVSYKTPVAQLVLVNCGTSGMEDEAEPDFSDFMKQYGYDEAEQEVTLQTSYVVDLENTSSSNAYTYESLQTIVAAGGVDVLAADEDVFTYFTEQQNYANLSDYLSDVLMEQYADDIVYATDPETDEEYPAGIRLEKNAWMEQYDYYPQGCVIGIVNGSEHKEAARQLLLYLLS